MENNKRIHTLTRHTFIVLQ